MKTLTAAGALLVLVLAGCAMPDSDTRTSSSGSGYRSGMSDSRDSRMQSDPANYHAADFGEMDNQPFEGSYSSNW